MHWTRSAGYERAVLKSFHSARDYFEHSSGLIIRFVPMEKILAAIKTWGGRDPLLRSRCSDGKLEAEIIHAIHRRHLEGKESVYRFVSIDQLLDDFLAEVERRVP